VRERLVVTEHHADLAGMAQGGGAPANLERRIARAEHRELAAGREQARQSLE
jgi:hypothetical protein